MFFIVMFTLCAVGISLIGLVILGKFPMNAYPVLMMPTLFLVFVINALQLHSNAIAYQYITESIFTFTTFVCLVSFLSVLAGWCYPNIRPKPIYLNFPKPLPNPSPLLFPLRSPLHDRHRLSHH
jgi:hypothetical protein